MTVRFCSGERRLRLPLRIEIMVVSSWFIYVQPAAQDMQFCGGKTIARLPK